MPGFELFPTQENNHERNAEAKECLKRAAYEFGFIERQEMTALREQIFQSPERLVELYAEYELIAMNMIEAVEDEQQQRTMILGLSILKALLYLEAGMNEDAYNELFDMNVAIDTHPFVTERQRALLSEIEEKLQTQ